ncbi:MAG: hypothetical protein GEU97_17085 [Actinophytocola sp.]|nr:hypothetical protein [Actinophytocola sp.]
MKHLAALIIGVLTVGLLTATPATAQTSCSPKVTKAWATKTVVVGPTYQVYMPLRAKTYDECAPITYLSVSWRRRGHYDFADLNYLNGEVPTETWGARAAVDPYLLTNSATGKHTIDVDWIEDADYNYATDQLNVGSLRLKRAARLGINAYPEPVRKGQTITVAGKLRRANWNLNEWRGYGYRYVKLQFKKAGSSTFVNLKTVKSRKYGKLKTTVIARRDGTFRWLYLGNGVTGRKASKGDYVNVT